MVSVQRAIMSYVLMPGNHHSVPSFRNTPLMKVKWLMHTHYFCTYVDNVLHLSTYHTSAYAALLHCFGSLLAL